MKTPTRPRSGVLLAALLTLAAPAWAGSDEVTHSGTVLTVDRTAGRIVLEELGPWEVKDGKTVLMRQTIVVTPSTQFSGVKRAAGAAPSGWIGGLVEVPRQPWQLQPGDFVSVSVTPGTPPMALKITVVDATQP